RRPEKEFAFPNTTFITGSQTTNSRSFFPSLLSAGRRVEYWSRSVSNYLRCSQTHMVERGASALPGSHPQRGPCSATPARYALGILEQIGVELPPRCTSRLRLITKARRARRNTKKCEEKNDRLERLRTVVSR